MFTSGRKAKGERETYNTLKRAGRRKGERAYCGKKETHRKRYD
jgi:hypothetical protein